MLAERMSRISASPTLKVLVEAEKMRRRGIDVVEFGAGEPDFDTPVHIKQAAAAALDQGFTKYTPAAGIAELKQAVCDQYQGFYGVQYAPSEVIITAGGKQALYNIAMVLFGALTARSRAAAIPRVLPVLIAALGLSAAATLGVTLALDVLEATPRTLVPLGGMVIGNAMVGASTALFRLGDEMRTAAAEVEARLALGATAKEAAAPVVRRSLQTGMIGVVDKTKTAGLVFIPGTMVGMLLAGADPVDAVKLQLILFYLLLGSVSISAVLAVWLASRRFFTPAHQLREPATSP